MSEFNYKEHRDSFVETDPDLKLSHKLFSMGAINGFIEHNSSPRGLMMSSHISQLVVINEPEEDVTQTGLEDELRKYTVAKLVENDSEIISVIKRYNMLGETDKVASRLVVIRDTETGELDIVDIPYANTFHPYFGFKYKLNEELDTYVRGDVLSKDTRLAVPPTVLDSGGYGFGKDINIANMSLPEVDEDGFVASKSFCEKFKFKIFDNRTIEVGENSFLLNIYGDENEYKPFPEIGDYINDSGVVAVARKYDPLYGPCLYGKDDVREFNPLFDEAVYTRGSKGKIVDIKCYYNPRRKKALPTGTDKYCFKYSDALLSYYSQIVETYDSMNNEYNRMFNKDITVSNAFNRLLVEAYGVLDSSHYGTKCKKMYRKETLDLFRIEFTIEYELTPGVKSKVTNLHGGKGTIVDVWEDEDMPVDTEGVRAELIMDPKSTVSRLNVGSLYERTIKSSMGKLERIVRFEYEKYNVSEPYELSISQITNLFTHASNFINITGSDLAPHYTNALHTQDREAMLSVVEEIINDKFRVFILPDNDKRKYEIVEELESSIYSAEYGKVKYNYHGVQKESVNNIMIAPAYIFLLSKIADSVLTSSSAKLNHFGIPIVTSKSDRYSLPSKNSPVRTQGETEGRIFVAYGGRTFLAELKDLNTSISSHSKVYMELLSNKTPTNINNIINRKEHPYGTERGLAILNSLWNSIGMELKYVKETNSDYEYVEGEDEVIRDITKVDDLDEVEFTDK